MDRRALAQGHQDVEQGIAVFPYVHMERTLALDLIGKSLF
jgi:hypothetical protein